MKCAKIKDVRKFEIGEIDKPVSTDGSVVLKVKSCGICGSDIHYFESGEPKGLVMGHEFAGVVVDPGARNDLKVGDRVTGLPISPCGECEPCKSGNPQYCRKTWSKAVGLSLTNPGGYAEYTSCRPDLIRVIPDNLSFDEAAMIEPSAVALHAVGLGDIKVGTHVLVIGGGIIGLMTCEFAKLDGADYIAMLETNMARAKKATTIGKANEYFDALDPDIIKKLIEKTNGGFDVVFECCGNSAAVSEALMAVKPGGTVVLVGVSSKPVTIPTVMAVMAENTIKGAIAYTEKDFDKTIELINNGLVDVKKYIDDIVPLEEANKSFERLTSGKDDAVKIIFHPEM
jgi:2-desacetyl-2-hydroxyethyl bacteriochlorophyllide A dehydrogenase